MAETRTEKEAAQKEGRGMVESTSPAMAHAMQFIIVE